MRRRIELAQAEHATKIRGKYLRAIEDEQFELLPSVTYVKGFLRTYADYLGLDGQLYVDEFNSRFVVGEDTALRARRSQASRRRNRRLETGIVLAALTVIAIVTVVVIGAWTSSAKRPLPARAPVVTAAPAHIAPPALAISAARGSSYVAVHRGRAAGPVVFQGAVARGPTEPF